MKATWVAILSFSSVLSALACNALLDNDPRHIAEPSLGPGGRDSADPGRDESASGESGASAQGGASSGGSESAAGAPNSAEGGAPACDTCTLAHATSECREGACAITACTAGFLDTNAKPEDGCEAGDIPSDGLLLWFMADQGLTMSDNLVSAWTEQSSSHIKATALSDAARPKRVGQSSGPQMLEFDGADDGLKLPEGFSTFNGATFFAVAEAYVADDCAGILSLSNGGDTDDIEFGRHHTNLLYYEVLGDYVEGKEDAFEARKRMIVSITQSSTGAVQLRMNGLLTGDQKTIPLPKAVVRTQNLIGRDTYTACPQAYRGLLGELILYTRGVSSAEATQIQTYLSAKWGIALASP